MVASDGKQILDLPSGYYFNPKDDMAIHYLKQKILGRELPADIIPTIDDLYTCHPQSIPYDEFRYGPVNCWWFFTSRLNNGESIGERVGLNNGDGIGGVIRQNNGDYNGVIPNNGDSLEEGVMLNNGDATEEGAALNNGDAIGEGVRLNNGDDLIEGVGPSNGDFSTVEGIGYWQTTKIFRIDHEGKNIGCKKTRIFFYDNPENNIRINNLVICQHIAYEFIAEEAAFEPQDLTDNVKQQMEHFVLCKICIKETIEGVVSGQLFNE